MRKHRIFFQSFSFFSQILCYNFFFFLDFSSKFVWQKNFKGVPDRAWGCSYFFFKGKQIKNLKLLYIYIYIFFFFQVKEVLGPPWTQHDATTLNPKLWVKYEFNLQILKVLLSSAKPSFWADSASNSARLPFITSKQFKLASCHVQLECKYKQKEENNNNNKKKNSHPQTRKHMWHTNKHEGRDEVLGNSIIKACQWNTVIKMQNRGWRCQSYNSHLRVCQSKPGFQHWKSSNSLMRRNKTNLPNGLLDKISSWHLPTKGINSRSINDKNTWKLKLLNLVWSTWTTSN